MADKSIAAALKAYFLRCPLLGDHPLGVNWLPDHGVAFSIDTTPASQILRALHERQQPAAVSVCAA